MKDKSKLRIFWGVCIVGVLVICAHGLIAGLRRQPQDFVGHQTTSAATANDTKTDVSERPKLAQVDPGWKQLRADLAAAKRQVEFYNIPANQHTFRGQTAMDRFQTKLLSVPSTIFSRSAIEHAHVVGANVGNELPFLFGLLPNAQFELYEPDQNNLQQLRSKFGNSSRVHIHPCAVSEAPGTATFYARGNEVGGLEGGGNVTVQVELCALDHDAKSLVSDPAACPTLSRGYIQIDTEGHELSVLKGAIDLISCRADMVFFECSDWYGQPARQSVQQKVHLMDRIGFDSYKLGGEGQLLRFTGVFWHPDYERLNFWSNCVSIRRGLPVHQYAEKEWLIMK
jgi:FkbM family methyltransferase